MKLDPVTLEYLRGEKFSNSLNVQYSFYEPIPNRVDFLTELVKGKQVLHLGCLDHMNLIEEKILNGQWLHKRLTESAQECLGIDIDSEAATYVAEKFGFKNIVLADFTMNQPAGLAEKQWDYAILGELLEHINNPVSFLENICKQFGHHTDRMVITVPNAWTIHTLKNAERSAEIINSDHRYWFTPYTLSRVIMEAGMEVEEIYFANRVPLPLIQLIRNKMLKMLKIEVKFPFTFASSIIAIARTKKK